jgi:hypothetical protein
MLGCIAEHRPASTESHHAGSQVHAVLVERPLEVSDLDMDAPWVRSPPQSDVEFIGADYSTLTSDLEVPTRTDRPRDGAWTHAAEAVWRVGDGERMLGCIGHGRTVGSISAAVGC